MLWSLLLEQSKIFDLLVWEFHFVNNYHKVNLIVYSSLLTLSYLVSHPHHFHVPPFLHCHFHHYQNNCQKVFIHCVIFVMSFFPLMYPHGFSTQNLCHSAHYQRFYNTVVHLVPVRFGSNFINFQCQHIVDCEL